MSRPEQIDQLTPQRLADVQGVFTDIDDTFSTDGKITAAAFDALWRLHEAELKIVIVTGRPAGWCDHIARFWPVDAVIGENGGFYFWHDGAKLHRRYICGQGERAEFRRKLDAVGETILREVPGCAVASDQPYRQYDLAIDICEDITPLPREDVLRIKELFEQAGATAKISSVHVNGWYGQFDKLSTAKLWARERLGVELADRLDAFVYCGDSPNDEPMFQFFPLSFGMANVEEFLPIMTSAPAFVTAGRCGEGFVEVAEMILHARSAGGAK